MKLHIGRRTLAPFRVASDPARLADAKMIVLEREEFPSHPVPVTPGIRYRLVLKAEVESSRPDAALVIFNTDQLVPVAAMLNWFPRYTGPVVSHSLPIPARTVSSRSRSRGRPT